MIWALFFSLVYTILQNRILDLKQADGILLTEYKSIKGDADVCSEQPPQQLNVNNVRSAHVYSVAFSYIRDAAYIAGLANAIQDVLQFDGVFYQNLMNNLDGEQVLSRIIAIADLSPHRVHASISAQWKSIDIREMKIAKLIWHEMHLNAC